MFCKLFFINIFSFFLYSFILATSIKAQVVISEVYPNPLENESEWVELVNVGTNSVDLSDWVIQDQLSTPKKIFQFEEIILQPDGYLVASFSGQLNNSGDGISLFDSVLNLITTMSYSDSSQGQSWSYNFKTGDYYLTDPTISAENIPVDGGNDPVEEENNQTDEIEPAPSPSPIIISENLFGKLSLLKVMSCPESSDEWFEVQNISNHSISEELTLVDEQDNIFSFSIDLSAQQKKRYYLDKHILNNTGDILSIIQGNDNILMTYQIPECKEKNKEFIVINGELKQINDKEANQGQVLGVTTEADQDEVAANSMPDKEQFEIDKSYLKNLQLEIEKSSESSAEAEVSLENEIPDTDSTLPFFTILIIFTGIILSFLGIMYLYGTEKSQDNTLD